MRTDILLTVLKIELKRIPLFFRLWDRSRTKRTQSKTKKVLFPFGKHHVQCKGMGCYLSAKHRMDHRVDKAKILNI
jgi:hypothetical protein